MSLFPNKNLFVVTSSIKPKIGAFTFDQRFEQTIQTLKNVRNKIPDSIIVLTDCSSTDLTSFEKTALSQHCNFYIDLSSEPNCKMLTDNGLKSLAENLMMFNTLRLLKFTPETMKLLYSVKRIFKFSGRSELEPDFNLEDYDNLFGKFVFKRRIPTWMPQSQVSHLFITRMFSMCPSLLDTYFEVIQKNIPLIERGYDTEHAHFANIPQQYLVEFGKLHCWGWIAGNGQIEHY